MFRQLVYWKDKYNCLFFTFSRADKEITQQPRELDRLSLVSANNYDQYHHYRYSNVETEYMNPLFVYKERVTAVEDISLVASHPDWKLVIWNIG